MGEIGVFYGSEWGNTEKVARLLKRELDAALQTSVCDLYDVKYGPLDELSRYRYLIFGVSTIDPHVMQADWRRFARALSEIDLTGRRIALYGLGDQEAFPDHFVDGLGILHGRLEGSGAIRIGAGWSTEGYQFAASRAVENDSFVGLVLDQDTQGDRTVPRIRAWVKGLVSELHAADRP